MRSSVQQDLQGDAAERRSAGQIGEVDAIGNIDETGQGWTKRNA
jgi:hypothetical protein